MVAVHENRLVFDFQLRGGGNPDHPPAILRIVLRAGGEEGPVEVIDADHRNLRRAKLEKSPFGREIAAEAAVAVQMIGREVQENRDVRRQRAGEVELVRGKLQHHRLAIGGRVKVQHAAPDIAAHLAGTAIGGEDVVDQGRGGRLAVGPRDADHPHLRPRHGDGAEEERDVIVHQRPGGAGGGDGGVRRRVKMGDAGGDDEKRRILPSFRFGQVLDGEPLGGGGLAGGFAVVPADRDRLSRGERAGGGEAGAAKAEDADVAAFVSADGDHGRLPRALT